LSDIVVVAPLQMAGGVTVSPDPVTANRTTWITAAPIGGFAPVSIDWVGLPQGCLVRGTATLECTPLLAGNFRVTAVATDALGEHALANTSLQVNPVPSLVESGMVQNRCANPTLLVVNANVSGGTPPFALNWSFSDGFMAPTTPIVTDVLPANWRGPLTVGLAAVDATGARAWTSHTYGGSNFACPGGGGAGPSVLPAVLLVLGVTAAAVGVATFVIARFRKNRLGRR
jgi:hypothetical protein